MPSRLPFMHTTGYHLCTPFAIFTTTHGTIYAYNCTIYAFDLFRIPFATFMTIHGAIYAYNCTIYAFDLFQVWLWFLDVYIIAPFCNFYDYPWHHLCIQLHYLCFRFVSSLPMIFMTTHGTIYAYNGTIYDMSRLTGSYTRTVFWCTSNNMHVYVCL